MPDERGAYCSRDYEFERQKEAFKLNMLLWAVFTGIVILFALFIAILNRAQDNQYKYLHACIEFHSVDRCMEFYRYNREELGLKP